MTSTQQHPSSTTITILKALATMKRKFEPYVPVISRFCGSSRHVGDLPDYESSTSPPGEFPPFHFVVVAAGLVVQPFHVVVQYIAVLDALTVIKYLVVVEIYCCLSLFCRFDPRSQHSLSRVTQANCGDS